MPGKPMHLEISLEPDPVAKRHIHEHLTALLAAWFGRADSNRAYAEQAGGLPGYVARLSGEPRGLLLLKKHSAISAEIFWLGVDPSSHRSGIGRSLVDAASEVTRSDGVKLLFAWTLHPEVPYEPYRRTRLFYEAMGFQYVLEEQFPDETNPLALYMKDLLP